MSFGSAYRVWVFLRCIRTVSPGPAGGVLASPVTAFLMITDAGMWAQSIVSVPQVHSR